MIRENLIKNMDAWILVYRHPTVQLLPGQIIVDTKSIPTSAPLSERVYRTYDQPLLAVLP